MKKKLFSLILMTLLIMVTGCGSAAKTEAPAPDAKQKTTATDKAVTKEMTSKKILVAYFSATGTTRAAAEKLAKEANADLFEIVPQQPYSREDLNYNDQSSRCVKEHNDPSSRPAIKNKLPDMQKYDVVFIGYPIWWGVTPNILLTFMESYDFAGKTLVPFCTVISSGFGNSDAELKRLAPKANWLPGKDLTDGNTAGFVAGLKL